MSKIFKNIICLGLVFLLAFPLMVNSSLVQAENTPTVFVLGDSTAANYTDARAPRAGWAQVIHNFFADGYMVKNYAQSGMSAHSCYDSLWQSVKLNIRKGDYLLIQFGHNDSAKTGKDDEGNAINSLYRWGNPNLGSDVIPPATLSDNPDDYSYKWYLKQFVTYAESVGAYPVLVTSVERRGDAISRTETASALYPWVKAMKELAEELNVPVVDIWSEVRTLISDMENESSGSTADLYMNLEPGEHPNYPDGAKDDTHLSLKGALKVSQIFANLLKTSDISLKNYLVADTDSVNSNTVLPERIKEDFYGAPDGVIESGKTYNNWLISGPSSAENTPLVRAITVDGDKALNFYRDGKKNTGIDSSVLYANYNLKKPLGADAADEVKESERYVRLKYKFRSEVHGAGFAVSFSGFNFTFTPENSRLFFGSSNNKYLTESHTAISNDKWYDVEIYCDLKNSKATLLIDNIRYYTEIALGRSKIENVKLQPSRCQTAGTNDTWSYFVDDIELSLVDEETYCDYVGILPDESYLMRETFNLYEDGTRLPSSWNGWSVGSSDNPVSMIKITNDPLNSSNKVLAFQRTGVPGSTNLMTKSFDTSLDNGYYEFSFKVLKHNENDNLFEITVKDGEKSTNSSGSSVDNGWKISINFNTGKISVPDSSSTNYSTSYSFNRTGDSITTDKWYDIKLLYNLMGDCGSLSLMIDGELVAENITPPNTTNNISERYNNGKIKTIIIGFNRQLGSTIQQKNGSTIITDTDYSGKGDLIADVKFDNIELKTIVIEPETAIFKESFSGTKAGERVTASYNDWTLSNSALAVSPVTFTEDPDDSSDNVISFGRIGVPSAQQIFERSFEAIEDGYYSYKFRLRSENEKDNYFKTTLYDTDGKTWDLSFDLQNGSISMGFLNKDTNAHNIFTGYFNEGEEKITRNKWYNIELILDLTDDDTGYASIVVDDRLLADRLSASNGGGTASQNNSSLSKIRIVHNRTHGSALLQQDMPGGAYDTAYNDSNELIANVLLDDIILDSITEAEASRLITLTGIKYEGGKISGVDVQATRVMSANEKILVAVYNTESGMKFKDISLCEAIDDLSKTSVKVKKELNVSTGDKVKVFLWNSYSLYPKSYFETDIK